MSSEPDLERLLRDTRKTLPDPDDESTRRARARVLGAIRPRRPTRFRVPALVAAMLLLAIGLGIGIGALVTPSGEAAKGRVGLGFLPEPGWFAFQTGSQVNPVWQTIAVASNVPLDPEDQVAGQAEPSGLPYATLLTLPPSGVVIQASFTRPAHVAAELVHDYPVRTLPLRLSDATPYIQYGTQIRPEEPLGQYQLRGIVEGHHVEVQIYFGKSNPTRAMRAEAQRQLERLVVESGIEPESEAQRQPASVKAPAAPSVIDKTYVCRPAFLGGIYKVEAHGRSGSSKKGGSWNFPALMGLSTSVSSASVTALDNEIVWLTAGRPSAKANLVPIFGSVDFPVRTWGTIGVNRRICSATKKKVSLSRGNLKGGAVGRLDERWDCGVPKQVLVRVRAVVASRSSLKSFRNFVRTTVPVKSAVVSMRTTKGKPLAWGQVVENGKSFVYTADLNCFPD